jgi:predicted glycoside hydrolase/deacetylase ChbG (UPF0249 family)
MIKNIIICADDFGYNTAVSSGIINLLNIGTVNATSCMVNMPACQAEMSRLKVEVTTKVDVGLHLNFTEGKSLTNCTALTGTDNNFTNLNSALIKSHLKLLNYDDIYREIKTQIELFKQYYGQKPDFIDGHQHVHQFPTIRTALLQAYSDLNLKENHTYIRSVKYMKGGTSVKKKIIQMTGSSQLHSKISKLNIPTNTTFSGAYNFSKAENYRNTIIKAYKNITNKGLIMCHPGLSSPERDLLNNSRQIEYAYFSSKEALYDLTNNNIKLSRGKDIF